MKSNREILEAALVAEPESAALHAAYADLLIEEGDPRGEYIRLELMREDPHIRASELRVLNKRVYRIRRQHESQWLGSLYGYVRNEPFQELAAATWKRGWLEDLYFHSMYLLDVENLRNCPIIRLLRSISLRYFDHFSDPTSLAEKDCEILFQELNGLPVLKFTICGIRNGDEVLERLVNQRFFTNLQHLAMNECSLTDDSALLLSNTPHIRNLKTLQLEDNYFSAIGVAALAEVGFTVGEQRDNPGWEASRD